MADDDVDAIGLIRESYRIEGITTQQCRSIFLDWAIRLPLGIPQDVASARLLVHYGSDAPDHPMTAILREAATKPPVATRRGGARARRSRSM